MEEYLTALCDGVKQGVSISGGPDRVVTDKPDPDFKSKPAGFTAKEDA